MSLSRFPKKGWISLILLALFFSFRTYQRFYNPNLVVTFFDVGQGDAALIQFPLGKTLLIDGGGGWNQFEMGSQVLFPELTRLGILTLDRILLSHPDNDHARGFLGVLNKLKVKELWLHGDLKKAPKKQLLVDIETQSRARGVLEKFISFETFEEIEGVKVQTLPLGDGSKKGNDKALVVQMEFGGCKMLFTGDIEKEGEWELLRKLNTKIDLLKVPHHGSLSSSQWGFLKSISPRWAVVSVGLKNSYGHPRSEVLQRYRALGVELFRTDFHGAIRFTFSPQGKVTCETPKGGCGVSECDEIRLGYNR